MGSVKSVVKSESYAEIRRVVDQVRVIDSHEHLAPEEHRVKEDVDALATLFPHYASSDLVSSGMSIEDLIYVRNPKTPLKQRWDRFSPYWEKMQNTGYARALNIAVKGLYGVEGIGEDTYVELSKRMKEANKKGLYRWILKEKSGIDIAITDIEPFGLKVTEVDRELFAPVSRFEDFVLVKERAAVNALERRCGSGIHTLDDLVNALESEFQRLRPYLAGVKIALAYNRIIHFEKTTHSEAEKVFNRIYSQRGFKTLEVEGWRGRIPEGISWEDAKPFQDFMVHKMIQLAIRHNLPVQIHTGLQEGNENIVSNSNPIHLVNLFLEYREAKVDIFHGGYPYLSELATLAKNFQNVYIDMAWLHVLSPAASRRALSEWLDTVPANKIIGFGGDYRVVEGVYGHVMMARENIAHTLAEKVEYDGYTIEEASFLAERLLRGNALELFFPKGLPRRRLK